GKRFKGMRLQGKTALVTGGSRGIGRACVERLALEGARVTYLFKGNQQAAHELASRLQAEGREARPLQADVSDSQKAEQVVADVLAAWGQIDILVNSAGVIHDGLFATMTGKQWHEVIETNLDGTYHYCRAVAQPMLSRRQGSIINISSVAAEFG